MADVVPTSRELEALKVLWRRGRATVREIYGELEPRDGELAYTTALSLLQTMEQKGLVAHESAGKAYSYYARVRRDHVFRKLAGGFLDQVFDGAMGEYVARALQSRRTSVEELEELEAMIAEAKKRAQERDIEKGEAMRSLSETVCDWLVDDYALTTVVLVAVVAVMGVLRQPARRLLVARSAVVGLAMLAILAALPGWPRASCASGPQPQPAPPAGVAASEQHPDIATPLPLADRIEPSRETPPAQLLPSASGEITPDVGTPRQPAVSELAVDPMPDWPALVGRAFLAGGGLMLAWLGIGFWQTDAIRRRSRPAPQWSRDALARIVGDGHAAPDLLVSEGLSQPVAVGLLRPTIILPARFVKDEPQCRLEAALAHEWAHIRNRDLWWIALSRLLMPVLFAHPVYWWLRRRTRDDQELLADAAAADGRVDYAESLLSWARGAPDRPRLAVAGSLALWERPSQLKRRIVVLLDRDFRVEPTCPKRWGLGVRGGMALAVLALSVLTFRPATVGADPPGSPVAQQAGQKPDPKASQATESGATVRVLDPDGKPASAARVYREPGAAVPLTQTGPDGSFRLSPDDVKAAREGDARFVVMAEGCGPAFGDPSVVDGAKVLHLVKDDVPIRGKVIDIQGRPVVEATVQLVSILWSPLGKLDEWLDVLKKEKVAYPVQYRMLRVSPSDDIRSLFPVVTTDPQGRFTLKGVGRERIAALLISGPGVETRLEFVATRDMCAVTVADFDRLPPQSNITYHGAAFDIVAGPGLEIVGMVRDKDTGEPMAGVTVQTRTTWGHRLSFPKTTTDAEGRYRLAGVPRTSSHDEQDVLVTLEDGLPYLPSVQHVGNWRGPDPIRKDFALKRGVLVRGRVTDQSTGKPIRATLSYYTFEDNPHLKDYPGYGMIQFQSWFFSNENGEYQIAVIPGRGILGARAGNDTYRLGVGIDKIKGLKMEPFESAPALPQDLTPGNYNTLVEIDPKAGDESVRADIELDPGRTLKGKLVDPDGEPVAGALMMGAEDRWQSWSRQPLPSADFEVHALGTRDKRGLLFYHEAKQLAGAYVIKPDEESPVTVRLERCGTLTGRLVDGGGLSRAGAQMTCHRPLESEDSRFNMGSLPSPIPIDKDGRFRVSGLVPGLKYSLTLWKGRSSRMIDGDVAKDVIIKAGETRDLGDIKLSE